MFFMFLHASLGRFQIQRALFDANKILIPYNCKWSFHFKSFFVIMMRHYSMEMFVLEFFFFFFFFFFVKRNKTNATINENNKIK
jgi:hypothetical protein